MPRYFIEVSYRGNRYGGFQKQDNAVTIQSELELALHTFYNEEISLTGSSRTDAGVHARSNYFHFDREQEVAQRELYNWNALLPEDIAVCSVREVKAGAHCRFDASYRRYAYRIYRNKNPFLQDRAYYFPYTLALEPMQEVAMALKGSHDFSTFSKKRTQVKRFDCTIMESEWRWEEGMLVYHVKGNRFLRGMVRGLVGTMLQLGRSKIGVEDWMAIWNSGDNRRADFSVPGHGLYLMEMGFSPEIWKDEGMK